MQDAALNDDEIESGIFGGGDDGGVDAMFFFVNRILIQEDTEIPEPAISAELVIIQAKNHKGFSETAVEKVGVFMRDMLDYTKSTAELTYLNQTVRDAIDNFRVTYKSILGSQHTLTVKFCYVTKSDGDPDPKVDKRVHDYLDGRADLTRETRRDARYYIDMVLCCQNLKLSKPSPNELATLLPKIQGITDSELKSAADYVVAKYKEKGGTDKIAKGPELTQAFLEDLAVQYPVTPKGPHK